MAPARAVSPPPTPVHGGCNLGLILLDRTNRAASQQVDVVVLQVKAQGFACAPLQAGNDKGNSSRGGQIESPILLSFLPVIQFNQENEPSYYRFLVAVTTTTTTTTTSTTLLSWHCCTAVALRHLDRPRWPTGRPEPDDELVKSIPSGGNNEPDECRQTDGLMSDMNHLQRRINNIYNNNGNRTDCQTFAPSSSLCLSFGPLVVVVVVSKPSPPLTVSSKRTFRLPHFLVSCTNNQPTGTRSDR